MMCEVQLIQKCEIVNKFFCYFVSNILQLICAFAHLCVMLNAIYFCCCGCCLCLNLHDLKMLHENCAFHDDLRCIRISLSVLHMAEYAFVSNKCFVEATSVLPIERDQPVCAS